MGPNPNSSSKSVIELLHILGLSLKADVRVGTLSGGEQKRLSIGVGMVSGKCQSFRGKYCNPERGALFTLRGFMEQSQCHMNKCSELVAMHQEFVLPERFWRSGVRVVCGSSRKGAVPTS